VQPASGAPLAAGSAEPPGSDHLPGGVLLPPGCTVTPAGHLASGGCDLVELVARHGSPLYVFNEDVLRGNCRAYRQAFAGYEPGAAVAYAAKAVLTVAIAAIMAEEGMHLDVVSAGELQTALAGGFPAARIHFHGNNKTPDEIEAAMDAGVGRFVVDNFHEIELLDAAARARGRRQPVLLRVAPGIEAHTHDYIRTGSQDSKFGFDLQAGQALEAARRTAGSAGLEYLGLHAHIGSQILDTAAVAPLAAALLDLAAEIRVRVDLPLRELNLGGGAGIRYAGLERTLPPADLVAAITAAVRRCCAERDLPLPVLAIEPGRSIVGEAGVAVYTVGASKRVPNMVPWVAVDGGMGDNIRPALYQAEYTVAVANRMHEAPEETVHIAGRYCESGDFLARSVRLPRLRPGDLLAFFSAGAYQYPMASNYNRVPRPCLLLVSAGRAHVMVERETIADLLARDRLPEHLLGARAMRAPTG
jgi:diaminopimelate decarboxylase